MESFEHQILSESLLSSLGAYELKHKQCLLIMSRLVIARRRKNLKIQKSLEISNLEIEITEIDFLQKKYLDKSCWFCVSSYRLWLLFTKEFLQICVLFQWVIATEVGDLKPNNFSWLSLTCLCAFRCTRKSASYQLGCKRILTEHRPDNVLTMLSETADNAVESCVRLYHSSDRLLPSKIEVKIWRQQVRSQARFSID